MPRLAEICVQGVESALAAWRGGADRIELCEDLKVGGVTPSLGAITLACSRLTIPVHVLVRPRGGDFRYTDAEFDVMRMDVDALKTLGASGVVLGLLNADGTLDRERIARLVDCARPMAVTFHKAFDDCRDPEEALEQLIDLGIERVLTSGKSQSAIDGLPLLTRLVQHASGRITILAGGGIALSDVPPLLHAGLTEIHVGSSVCIEGKTDAVKVHKLVEAVRAGC
jgi:copper homeostasis protein